MFIPNSFGNQTYCFGTISLPPPLEVPDSFSCLTLTVNELYHILPVKVKFALKYKEVYFVENLSTGFLKLLMTQPRPQGFSLWEGREGKALGTRLLRTVPSNTEVILRGL